MLLQVPLHPPHRRMALQRRFPMSPHIRTPVRMRSVRGRSYLTNICSPLRIPRSHTAPLGHTARPARSCCSRMTTTLTGRSTRTSGSRRPIRTAARWVSEQSQIASHIAGQLNPQRGSCPACARSAGRHPYPPTPGERGQRGDGHRAISLRRARDHPPQPSVARSRKEASANHEEPPKGRLLATKKPAASYSPRPLRAKYHRR